MRLLEQRRDSIIGSALAALDIKVPPNQAERLLLVNKWELCTNPEGDKRLRQMKKEKADIQRKENAVKAKAKREAEANDTAFQKKKKLRQEAGKKRKEEKKAKREAEEKAKAEAASEE